MEKGIESWLHRQHTDWQSPNLNTLSAPFDLEQQNMVPAYMNPSANMVTNGTSPLLGPSGVPHGKASQPYEPHGWFYCLPRFRQACAPLLNSVPKEKYSASPSENCGNPGASDTGSGCAQKRFLVFDQSGDQTTLIFSSGIGAPIKYLPSWCPKPSNAFCLNEDDHGTKKDVINPSVPISIDEYNGKDYKDDVRSEMHEDTEELDALLYSDDENDYYEDDEVTSTGHSPSSMTAYDIQGWSEETEEEVASSGGPTKRQKLLDGDYDVPLLMDTASSVKTKRCFESEDVAESCCGCSKFQVLGESGSLSGNKRSRKEKIRETVNILQSIIPDVKGKDAVVVLDEAIHYLRSLKGKAKALGLDSL